MLPLLSLLTFLSLHQRISPISLPSFISFHPSPLLAFCFLMLPLLSLPTFLSFYQCVFPISLPSLSPWLLCWNPHHEVWALPSLTKFQAPNTMRSESWGSSSTVPPPVLSSQLHHHCCLPHPSLHWQQLFLPSLPLVHHDPIYRNETSYRQQYAEECSEGTKPTLSSFADYILDCHMAMNSASWTIAMNHLNATELGATLANKSGSRSVMISQFANGDPPPVMPCLTAQVCGAGARLDRWYQVG